MKKNIMYWNDLDGTELLARVFSKPVEMSFIDIFDLKIDRNGPSVIISFDLIDQLPDTPPLKWGKSYNRCRAGIYCIGVNALEIKGVATSMQASISINKTGGNNAVTIHGEKFYLKLCCSCINFVGPPVYTSL